jgi:hypothetical protein
MHCFTTGLAAAVGARAMHAADLGNPALLAAAPLSTQTMLSAAAAAVPRSPLGDRYFGLSAAAQLHR